MKAYEVQYRIKGLKGVTLTPGTVVRLEPEEAAYFLSAGSLVEVNAAKPAPAEIPPQTETAEASAPAEQPVDLSTMTKAELVEYAQATLGLALDINRKKDELLAAIAAAAKTL